MGLDESYIEKIFVSRGQVCIYLISGIGTVTDDEFVVCLQETKNFQNVQLFGYRHKYQDSS